jgi:DNA-binding winged helix-turn-helix (wHTH) protein/tetratricopeptide (TPR) repeat protein
VQYRVADIVLDSASRLVRGPQGPLAVPRRVFDCLICLIEHRDRAVARDELILYVWNRHNVSDTQLAQTVLRARRLLCDDGSEQRLIRTVPGFGYHWIGPVCVEAGDADDGIANADALAELPHEDEPIAALVDPVVPMTEHVAEGAAMTRVPMEAAATLEVTPLDVAAGAQTALHRPTAAQRRPKRRWSLLAAAAAVILAVIACLHFGTAYLPTHASAAAESPRRIVVLPVDMDAETAKEVAWARLGLMDLLATRLRAEGAVVPPSESVLAALAALSSRGVADLRPQALQADLLVKPKLVRLASGWEFSLEGRRANGTDLAVQERHPQVLPAVAAAGDALLVHLGRARHVQAEAGDETVVRLRAALLGNELATVRDWLSTLPRAQREDREMRYLAAEVDYRAGRLDESRTALDALLRDESAAGDAPFRGRVLAARGSLAMRQRDDVAAERDFAAAIAALAGHEGRDLGRAYMGRGGVALRQQRHDEAEADLTRARALLDTAGDDLGVARADVNLALLDRLQGHPLEALERLQSAAQRFGDHAAVNELSATLVSLVDLQCGLLRWNDALETSASLLRLVPQLPDPQLRNRLRLARADVLLGLGRLGDAAALLASLDVAAMTATADIAYRDVLAAELALARGDAIESARLARGVLSVQGHDVRSRAALVLLVLEQTLPIPETSTKDDVDTLLLRGIAESAGLPNQAGTTLRAALRRAARSRDLREQRYVLQALSRVAGAGSADELFTLAAPLAVATTRDFDTALLFAGLHRARNDADGWRVALDTASALAGERRVPAELAAAHIGDEETAPPKIVRASPR